LIPEAIRVATRAAIPEEILAVIPEGIQAAEIDHGILANREAARGNRVIRKHQARAVYLMDPVRCSPQMHASASAAR